MLMPAQEIQNTGKRFQLRLTRFQCLLTRFLWRLKCSNAGSPNSNADPPDSNAGSHNSSAVSHESNAGSQDSDSRDFPLAGFFSLMVSERCTLDAVYSSCLVGSYTKYSTKGLHHDDILNVNRHRSDLLRIAEKENKRKYKCEQTVSKGVDMCETRKCIYSCSKQSRRFCSNIEWRQIHLFSFGYFLHDRRTQKI